MADSVLEMRGITKSFPGVKALEDVSISVAKGEVLALLGENGAGKSTLIKILSGVYRMDSGTILIEGQEHSFATPQDAQRAGIGVIYQELCLEVDMSISDNLFLGREMHKAGGLILDRKGMIAKSQKILTELGLAHNPATPISHLTIAQRQMIEIARAISFDAKIIVMDEPTSSLSKHEVDLLFKLIDRLRLRGIAMIYISHRMDEIFSVADRVTVLRDGRTVGTRSIKTTSSQELIGMMVGRPLSDFYHKENHASEEIVLEAEGIVTSYSPSPLSFTLRRGEVLGFSGLIGAGRSELMRVLFGVDPMLAGTLRINGRSVSVRRVHDALAHGIALVPENRKEEGLVLVNSVGYNLTLLSLKKFIDWRVHHDREERIIQEQICALNIKTYGKNQMVNDLSGGNQQKIVIGKWLAVSPSILILDEPTRGIDVGAKAEIYEIINHLTAQGVSIIMVSSELPEIVNMSDRVVVMMEGHITKILEGADISQTSIMRYAVRSETAGKEGVL